jgi:hypothetical protein
MANRCRVKEGEGEYVFGEFLGLLYMSRDTDGDVDAIVRLDGHGLFLTARPPSRVELLDLETSSKEPA